MRKNRAFVPQRRPIFLGCGGESEQAYGQVLNDLLRQANLPFHLEVVNLNPGAGDPFARLKRAGEKITRRRTTRSDFYLKLVLMDSDQVDNNPAKTKRCGSTRAGTRHQNYLARTLSRGHAAPSPGGLYQSSATNVRSRLSCIAVRMARVSKTTIPNGARAAYRTRCGQTGRNNRATRPRFSSPNQTSPVIASSRRQKTHPTSIPAVFIQTHNRSAASAIAASKVIASATARPAAPIARASSSLSSTQRATRSRSRRSSLIGT